MIIKNDNEAQKVLDFINANDKIAFDIESTGLNVRKDAIIGFGVSNADEGFYIAHMEWRDDKLIILVSKEMCVKILNALKGKKLITWNGSFDTRFTLHFFNVNLINSLWSDAMLAKHTTDEEMPFRLKDCAKREFGEDAAEEQRLMKESIKANGGSSKQFYKADLSIMGKYCIVDCLLTFRLNEIYLKRLEKEGLTNFYFKDEVMPLYLNVTIPMELKGVRVDAEKLETLSINLLKDIQKIESEIQCEIKPLLEKFETWFLWKDYAPKKTGLFAQTVAKHYKMSLPLTATGKFSITKANLELQEESLGRTFLLGGAYLPAETVRELQLQMFKDFNGDSAYMFNLKSKAHLKKVFFEELGEEPLTTTDLGSPQCNDDFLESMAKKYGWCEKLRVYNKLIKCYGTYIERYYALQEDGIFYPSWFMHRTTSGRFGGDLMQLPRQLEDGESLHPLIEKYNNAIRDCIISGKGRKLIGADYASLEIGVFSDDSGDEALLEVIRNGEDFYSKVAIGVNKLEHKYSADKKADNFFKKHEPLMRQNTKPYALGIRYGLGDFSLSHTLEITQKEAKEIIKDYFLFAPKLKTRMTEIRNSATALGYVKSRGGRVRHMPLLRKLHYSYGDILMDGLKIWQKWGESPAKYKQMKHLGRKYRDMVKNAYNFPIQSYAATICNKACVEIAKELKRCRLDAYICMQIHDEVVISCAEKDVKRVSKIMQYCMENTTKLSIPLSAEPEVGIKYGDIK